MKLIQFLQLIEIDVTIFFRSKNGSQTNLINTNELKSGVDVDHGCSLPKCQINAGIFIWYKVSQF